MGSCSQQPLLFLLCFLLDWQAPERRLAQTLYRDFAVFFRDVNEHASASKL